MNFVMSLRLLAVISLAFLLVYFSLLRTVWNSNALAPNTSASSLTKLDRNLSTSVGAGSSENLLSSSPSSTTSLLASAPSETTSSTSRRTTVSSSLSSSTTLLRTTTPSASATDSSVKTPSTVPPSNERLRCLSKAGFTFNPHTPSFPKNVLMSNLQLSQKPSTFSARCEWVFGIRVSFYGWIPHNSSWGDINVDPRCIFIRSDLLQVFHDRILPCLPKSKSFVIITGDADSTTPRQIDPRYGEPLARKAWNNLLEDARIKHIFVEHLDENVGHVKVSPIPVGLNPSEFPNHNVNFLRPRIVGLSNFSERVHDRVLRCDRYRDGKGLWEERGRVNRLCNSSWANVCVSKNDTERNNGSPLYDMLLKHTFVLCVRGGGIDPNPKIWETLMAGAIPIARRFAGGGELYHGMPVVFVDEWTATTITADKLKEWLNEWRHFFEIKALRDNVVEKLYADYWWKKVESFF